MSNITLPITSANGYGLVGTTFNGQKSPLTGAILAHGEVGAIGVNTTTKTSLLSSNKLPEFIREEYPQLVLFMEAYYEYVARMDSIRGQMDLDTATAKYVEQHKSSFVRDFGDSKFLDTKEFVRSNKEFFASKGSEAAFVHFFRSYFGEEITVVKPSFIEVSGGNINRDYFMTLETYYGSLEDSQYIDLEINNANGIFYIETLKIEEMPREIDDPIVHRVFFNLPKGLTLDVNQWVIWRAPQTIQEEAAGELGVVKYVGLVKLTPKTIKVVSPGDSWVVGQVITIPGKYSNTTAQVKRVTSDRGIKELEIFEFGYKNTPGYQFIANPWPGKPGTANISYNKTPVAFTPPAPGAFNHSITIIDGTFGVNETLQLTKTGFIPENRSVNVKPGIVPVRSTTVNTRPNRYAYQHNLTILDGTEGISESFKATHSNEEVGNIPYIVEAEYNYPDPIIIPKPDYSLALWQQSNAVLEYEFATMAKSRAFYNSDIGLISNDANKIHDSYFYQAFSYLIQTEQNIENYRGQLESLHPAGMKFFADLVKKFSGDLTSAYVLYRSMSSDRIYLNDVNEVPTEFKVLFVIKQLIDGTEPATDFDVLNFTKVLLENTNAATEYRYYFMNKVLIDNTVPATDYRYYAMNKPLFDVTSSSEVRYEQFIKQLSDTTTSSEVWRELFTKILADNTIPATEYRYYAMNKVLIDALNTVTEFRVNAFTKALLDTTASVETVVRTGTKQLVDTINTVELLSKVMSRSSITDTVVATTGDTRNLGILGWADSGYVDDGYAALDLTLTLT